MNLPVIERKTLRHLLDRYIQEFTPLKAKTTQVDEKAYAKFLKREFAYIYLDQLTPGLISQKLLKWRKQSGGRTINRRLALLSSAFDKGIYIWKWCQENPVKHIPREKEIKRVKFFIESEFEIIFEALPEWLKPIIVFAKNTGLRLGNIANLRWVQVDLEQRFITIEDNEMKNNNNLGIPLNNVSFNILNHFYQNKKGQFVFCRDNGKPYTRWGISQRFKKTCVKVKLSGYRFHDLRHDFCSKLVQKGANLYKVMALAGHKDIASTQRYAHLRRDDLRESIELLNIDESKLLYPEKDGM